MKKRYLKLFLLIIFPIIAYLIILLNVHPKSNPQIVSNITGREYNIYVVYSSYCPHCRHLLDFLSSIGVKVHEIPMEDFSVMKIYRNLSKYFSGVPFIFAEVNNSLIIIEGFPAKSQDIDGYFYGKKNEENMCKEMNGTAVYINNTYMFCKVGNKILGNKYAILWLIEQCNKYGCKKL